MRRRERPVLEDAGHAAVGQVFLPERQAAQRAAFELSAGGAELGEGEREHLELDGSTGRKRGERVGEEP